MSVSAASTKTLFGQPGTASQAMSGPVALRLLLLVGCLAAVACAASLGEPTVYLAADAELGRLLRGMALIKGSIVLAAVAILVWRLGHPVSARMAGVYLAGAWLTSGASMLIWQLTLIPAAALCFHVGELALLVTAWRDCRAEPNDAAAVFLKRARLRQTG